MPFKDPEKRRVYRRNWYKKNKESELAHVRKRKLSIRKWSNEYKKKLKCSLCSESHPATIDFHHKKGKKKENEIGYMVGNGYSIDKIKEEITKCQVLCANCHRKLHYKNNNL